MFSNCGSYLVYLHTSATGLAAMSEKGDAPAIFAWKTRYFGKEGNSSRLTYFRHSLGIIASVQSYDFGLGTV